ncbi:MAG: aminotransferase class V-fold PLP-dependent enzyme, partial [[Ruminococcus] gnavus]|nr:aminotransferase class V-fold PLP-dependent enzyme [Mediterraneibacter gnavus]
MIYLDSAATSYDRPKEVAQAVYDAILTMGNAGRGSHASSLTSARMIYETRRLLCELFGGPAPEQVVFTYNATEALNIAIQGLARPGIRLAATAMDHNSVLRPLYLAEQRGSTIEIVGVDEKGRISLESVEILFQKGLDVLVCTHASNVTGNVNPIREIGRLCKKYGVLFVVDASQTAGILPIDM